MKSLLLKLTAFILHPIKYCTSGAIIVGSRLRIQKGNSLHLDHTHVKKSDIFVYGTNTSIEFDNADIHNSTILVMGNNCRLTINNGAKVYNLHLAIKSNDCIVTIGHNTSFGGGTVVCAGTGNSILFGNNCMIAEGVDIWNSDTHVITVKGEDLNNHKPITIRDHVWIGKDVTVLKGVNIGDNAIIGMKSVVTHDILPGTINAGIPARVLQEDANWRH